MESLFEVQNKSCKEEHGIRRDQISCSQSKELDQLQPIKRARLVAANQKSLLTRIMRRKNVFLTCHLPAPSQQQRHQNMGRNMFKINIKDTRTMLVASIVLVSLLLTLNVFHILLQCFYRSPLQIFDRVLNTPLTCIDTFKICQPMLKYVRVLF